MSSVISKRTWAIFAIGIVAIAAIIIGIAANLGGDTGTLAISDFGELIVVGASAAVVLWVASTFGRSEPVRLQWMAIGLGVLMFAIGDGIWTYLEVIRGVEPPYPGAPDIFYLLIYPFLAFGLLRAGLAYKGLVDLRPAIYVSVAVVVALAAVLYFSLLKPHVLDAELSAAETAISIAYPVGDLLFALGPALFTLVVVFGLGRGRFAWPWWAVTAGVALVALSDSAFSYLQAYDLYGSGSFIDYGWSLGFLLVAVGASILYDLAHPAAVASIPVSSSQAA